MLNNIYVFSNEIRMKEYNLDQLKEASSEFKNRMEQSKDYSCIGVFYNEAESVDIIGFKDNNIFVIEDYKKYRNGRTFERKIEDMINAFKEELVIGG